MKPPRLISLLLLSVVLVPFFIPSNWANSAVSIAGAPAAEFYDTLQSLPANSLVVLAFDYDPSQAGEMDLIAKAVVRHLMQRRVNVITLSTLDTGAPLARRIMDEVTRDVKNYVYGTNYVNLGFLPGHEAGLANLATTGFAIIPRDWILNQPLDNFPITRNVRTLRDVRLVIELAGSDDALRAWVEQVQPRVDVPLVAGVSAAVEPKARAYHDTPAKQIAAMVSGLVGAAQYEVLSNQPGLALVSVNAQSAAQLLLASLAIVGTLAFWTSRIFKRDE
jgi:hypothetical protein